VHHHVGFHRIVYEKQRHPRRIHKSFRQETSLILAQELCLNGKVEKV